MIYHHTPFHTHPVTLSWTPYIIATDISPWSQQQRCGGARSCRNKKQKTSDKDDSKIIYHDRTTRINRNDKDQIVFSIDLPGVKASNIKVEFHDCVLKVQADLNDPNNTNETKKYERRFTVKEEVDAESSDLKASYEDGVLLVTVPVKKLDESKPSSIVTIPIITKYPPSTDDWTTSKYVRFSVDLPGVSANNISLELKEDIIKLKATRKLFDKESTIDRQLHLTRRKVDVDTLKAYLMDGVLTISGEEKKMEPKMISVLKKSVSEESSTANNDDKEDEDMVVVDVVAEEK